MSRVELLCVVAAFFALIIFGALLIQWGSRSSRLTICSNNLQRVGLAIRAHSYFLNADWYFNQPTNWWEPLDLPHSEGVFRYFQAVSNELGNPQLLLCPTDWERHAAANFTFLGNSNISYFLQLNASDTSPVAVLAGDRNLIVDGKLLESGNYEIPTEKVVSWGKNLHKNRGNIVLSHGRVEQDPDGKAINRALQNTPFVNGPAANILAIP